MGTTYQATRRLFTSVVAPRIDYATIVWHRPAKYGLPSRPPQLSKLESAQRTAMKAVLGSLRTTATTALEVESGLMPALPYSDGVDTGWSTDPDPVDVDVEHACVCANLIDS